jgi:Major tropism determinant N-terminal domain
MLSKIQLRRGSASDWTTANPVLSSGEIGVELGSPNKIKIGNGSSTWSQLPYGSATNASDISGLGEMALVNDAPDTLHQYARVHGEWQTISGGGAGNPFDQSLNTTDSVSFHTVNINGGAAQINEDGSAVFGNVSANSFQSYYFEGGIGSGTQIDQYGNFEFGSGFGAGNEWDVYGPTWTGFRISGFRNAPDQSAAFVVNPFLGSGAAFTANNTLDDGSGNAGISGSISFANGTAGFDSLGNLHATNFTGGGGGVSQQAAIAFAIALG